MCRCTKVGSKVYDLICDVKPNIKKSTPSASIFGVNKTPLSRADLANLAEHITKYGS